MQKIQKKKIRKSANILSRCVKASHIKGNPYSHFEAFLPQQTALCSKTEHSLCKNNKKCHLSKNMSFNLVYQFLLTLLQ